MAINEKFLQEELAVLQADFDKTKKKCREPRERSCKWKKQLKRNLWCYATN